MHKLGVDSDLHNQIHDPTFQDQIYNQAENLHSDS